MKLRTSNFELRTSERGQAILEVLVALAIGIIIATAFVSLGVISVRNSTFSKNQVTATQLATEGIEAIITIRDQNSIGGVQGIAIVDQWSELYGVTFTSCTNPNDAVNLTLNCDGDFVLLEVGAPCPVGQRCIQRNTTVHTDPSWRLSGANAQFSRKIRISDAPERDIKNVIAFVWWTDANGPHTSLLTRKLHRNRLE